MYPPIRVSWLLDLLPVVIGNRLALLHVLTEGRYGLQSLPTDDGYVPLPVLIVSGYWLLPVPTDGELVLLPKIVGSELVPLLGILEDGEHVPPLALAGNRPVLLSVPAVDEQILKSAIVGRIRGLLLA